ncbi:Lar family restriction alleviation protein [Ottowia sp. VDI28]|uniref:Lar family restriction alleviation protein n=1 Tax=Ottowia sp. VDI28 TaxID=3133968 RepID=UPI003C30A034
MTTPTPQDYALKPCPFCAGAEIFIEPDERGSGGQWVGPVHVGCKACGCQLCADDESKAVALWNRRAPQSGWISVDERLPEQRERARHVVAIWKKTYAADSNYPGEGVRRVVQDWVVRTWPQNFTRWSELPPLPPSTKGAE